jgi:hypothetical protein
MKASDPTPNESISSLQARLKELLPTLEECNVKWIGSGLAALVTAAVARLQTDRSNKL